LANFPNRPFTLSNNLWLKQQDVPGNRSLVGFQQIVTKTGTSPTQSGGEANREVVLNGVKVSSIISTGFNFVAAGPWIIAEGEAWVPHAADGTLTITMVGTASFDILGYTSETTNSDIPPIARASTPRFQGGSTFDAGTAVTIHTDWASNTFRHNLSVSFGNWAQQIATNVGGSTTWTPPLSLLEQIPNSTQGGGTLWAETFDGSGRSIGIRSTAFTLRAPSTVIPTISSLSVADNNPTVASVIGAFVQGLSSIVATVNAQGAYGSSIKSRAFSIDGTSAASGGVIRLNVAGSRPIGASARDSRDRLGTFNGGVTVLAYAPPSSEITVRRSTNIGTPDDNGTSLRVDLAASVSSLVVGGTQKNALTIRVWTRPRGGSAWTARNVINHSALSYNSWFLVGGGSNYPIDDSFDVRIDVEDNLGAVRTERSVATAKIYMHWHAGGVGFGKFWERGAGDFNGPVYAEDRLLLSAATFDEVAAGQINDRAVTPATLLSRTATADRNGLVQYANVTEARDGLTTSRAMSPGTTRQFFDYRLRGGVMNGSTDANGDILVIHNLGRQPASALATLLAGSPVIPQHLTLGVYGFNATTFTVRVWRRDTGTVLASNPVNFSWLAFA
jgi:hypothetical protein